MKKSVISILACILMVGVFFLGKQFGTAENAAISEKTTAEENTTPLEEIRAEEDAAEQNLNISFDHNLKALLSIPLEQGNYTSVNCTGMENITIQIDGIPMDLEKALTEGHISVDEIVALARADDRKGFCNEVAQTENGVTHFIYYYNNLRLYHVYDVYETPDGSKHMITGLSIYSIGFDPVFSPSFDQSGHRIDYEDWGLEFEVLNSDNSSITVKCTQSGGQQIGTLTATDFILLKKNSETQQFESPISVIYEPTLIADGALVMDGETELFVDFAQYYGEQDAGEYILTLFILDQYNEEDMHPLMRNYHDRQTYQISFTIE